MTELFGRGDAVMNLMNLILIAALSGGIVAVSLRLRAFASSARMWTDIEGTRELHGPPPPQSPRARGTWLPDPFGLGSDVELYQQVNDRLGN